MSAASPRVLMGSNCQERPSDHEEIENRSKVLHMQSFPANTTRIRDRVVPTSPWKVSTYCQRIKQIFSKLKKNYAKEHTSVKKFTV